MSKGGEITEIVCGGRLFPVNHGNIVCWLRFSGLRVGDKLTIQDPETGIKCEQTIREIDLEKRIVRFEGVVHQCEINIGFYYG
jgi:hypothetical protein